MSTDCRYATFEEMRAFQVFADVDADDLALIAPGLVHVEFAAGETIFHQGTAADCAMFIATGAVDVLADLPGGGHVRVTRCDAGAMVGESSLVESGVRAASVRCREPVTAFRMGRRFFRASIAQNNIAAFRILARIIGVTAERLRKTSQRIVECASTSAPESFCNGESRPGDAAKEAEIDFDYRRFLPVLPFFSDFAPEEIDELMECARATCLPRGGVLFGEGDAARSCHIVIRGSLALLAVHDGCQYPLDVLGPGSLCGAGDIIEGRERGVTCRAITDAVLLELTDSTLHKLLAPESWLSFRFQVALCDAQVRALARANRRLSHETVHAALSGGG